MSVAGVRNAHDSGVMPVRSRASIAPARSSRWTFELTPRASIGIRSELVEAARQVAKRPENVLGLLLRDLSREEIAVLEDQGCQAQDWAQVQVAQDFVCFRVRRARTWKGSAACSGASPTRSKSCPA